MSDSIRVLHVDDDPEFAETAAVLLEREDDRFDVEMAGDAEEGLERLATGDFDCVVSDYEMPGRDGIAFLMTVRERYGDLPFVLFTARGSEAVASEAIAAGVTDYIQKGAGPDRYTILAHRVSNAVAADRSRAEASRRRHRLEQILKTVPGCVVQLNTDGEFVFANQRAEEVLGLERETVTDRRYNDPEWQIRDLDGEPIPDEELPFRRVLDSGEPLYGFRHRIRWPDGRRKTLLVNGAPVFDDGAVESVVFSLVDITADEEQAAALEETERRLDLALEATDTGVWEWYPETGAVRWNETLERVMGMEPGSFEGTFEAFAERVHPDDLADVEAAAEQALSGDGVYDAEFRIFRDDGEVRWAAARGRLVTDDDGDERMVGIHHDVTERKRRERDLERTTRYLDAILENTTTPMFVKDAEGRYRLVNDVYLDVFGLDEDDTVGYTDEEVHPSSTVDEVRENDRRVIEAGEPVTAEERVVVDGEERTYLVSKVPLYDLGHAVDGGDDGPDGLFGVAKDVTERTAYRRRLEALHAATERLTAADTETELVSATIDAAKQALDRPYSVVRLRDDDRLVPAGVSDELESSLDSECPAYEVGEPTAGLALSRGEPVAFDDVTEVDDDVDRGDARAAVYLPLGDRGVVSIAADRVGAFDESDVHLAEILAGHAAAVLDRVDRTRELERQNERLEEFASVVSHDLRNPLSVAEGHLDLADADEEHVAAAMDAIERSQVLVDDLLSLAREGEQVYDDTDPVALADAVERCWETVETADATLQVRVDPAREVVADPRRLRRLLENLVANAVEHGGENVSVVVDGLDDGGGFYVADDGPGIPPDARDHVFESGYSTAESNTGFGLRIVQRIAAAHGWSVTATESDAGGARIEVVTTTSD